MKVTEIEIDRIVVDHETQSRAATNDAIVEEYAARWKEGSEFPPVELFADGKQYHVGDGIHRILGASQAGLHSINAHVTKGSRHDAAVYACGANKSHGLKRTNADKRHAVEKLLKLEPEWADNRIAEHVGVHNETVATARRQLTESVSCEVEVNPPTRVGKDGRKRAAPKAKPAKPAPVAEESTPSPAPKAPVIGTVKPPKNGRTTIDVKSFKECEATFGKLVRLFSALGILEDVWDEMDAIATRLKVMA